VKNNFLSQSQFRKDIGIFLCNNIRFFYGTRCYIQVGWRSWMADLEELKIPLDAKFSDIIVPTMDTIRSTYILELLLGAQKTVG